MDDTTLFRLHALAQPQHGALHRRQLRGVAATPEAGRWLRSRGVLHAVTRDVFVMAGAPTTWEQRLWLTLLEAGPGAQASHRTAAALLKIPNFTRDVIEVVRRELRPHPAKTGTIHQSSWLPPGHRVVIEGIPCSSLARCLFELAGLSHPRRLRRGRSYVHEDRVERAVDDAFARLGLQVDALADVVATLAGRGRPGSALMRRLLADRGEGYCATESALEDLLESVLAAHGLPAPTRQNVLGDQLPAGRVDFVYLDARLVLEADSRRHHTALLDYEHDQWRDLELKAAGYDVVRVTWRRLSQEGDRFAAKIGAILEPRVGTDLRRALAVPLLDG
jgi:very-short-patch-repair endonuclease